MKWRGRVDCMRQIGKSVGQLEQNLSIGEIHGLIEDYFESGLKETIF
jgi:hypothetical protein